MRQFTVREIVVLVMTVTVSLCLVALVGAATYAVIANTIDWTTDHVKGPNITAPLATLLGSLLSAVVAGVVGYLTGKRASTPVVVPMPTESPETPSMPPGWTREGDRPSAPENGA